MLRASSIPTAPLVEGRPRVGHAKIQKRYFLDAIRRKFRSNPRMLLQGMDREINIENNLDLDEPRLPEPGETQIVKTYLPFVISSVYQHPRKLYQLASASRGGIRDRIAKATLLKFGRGDLVTKDWLREFDQGSAGAFAMMAKSFENKNPLSLRPFCSDMFWTTLKDAWPAYASAYEYNLRVYDLQQTNRWINFIVDLPKIAGQETAVYRLGTGASIKFSVPPTDKMRRDKRIARELALEVTKDMLSSTGMKQWQITEYLAGRPIGQVDLQGNVVPVYSSLDSLPEPVEQAKKAQQNQFGKKSNVVPQFGGLLDNVGGKRPVGAHAVAPELIRRLYKETELTVPGSLRSLTTYIESCNKQNPDMILNQGQLKIYVNVLYNAMHDLKLWRKGQSDKPIYECLDKPAPHFVTYETTVPLNPLASYTTTWNVFDMDAFVQSQSSEFRRQFDALKVISAAGMTGEERAKAKAMLVHGERLDKFAKKMENPHADDD